MRGSHVQRSVPWDGVSKVEYGPRILKVGLIGTFKGRELFVKGRRSTDFIRVLDGLYDAEPKSFQALADSLTEYARAHSVPVEAHRT